MKQFKRAKLYLKRNLKVALLSSIMIFILANIIFLILYFFSVNQNSENTSISNIEYATTIVSEMTDEGGYGYHKDIHKQVHSIIDEISKYQDDERVKRIEYHVMVKAFSNDYKSDNQLINESELNNQIFYGMSLEDLKLAKFQTLKENEILVPKGYQKNNGEEIRIGDELNYLMPVFDEYGLPFKDNLIETKEFKLKVAGIYENEDINGINKPIILRNEDALKYYDEMYQLYIDTYQKLNKESYIKNNDGVLYEAKVHKPTIYVKDFYSLKEINGEMIRMNYRLKIHETTYTTQNLKRDYSLDSTIDDAMKIANSISQYSRVINVVLFGIMVVIIISIYFVLDIFLKERKREFAIYNSLGEKVKDIQIQYLFEQVLCMLPSFILSILSSFFLSKWAMVLVKEANFNQQREIFIADNKYNELLESQKMIDDIYHIGLNINIIMICFITILAIISLITYFGFRKYKKIGLNDLLRYD